MANANIILPLDQKIENEGMDFKKSPAINAFSDTRVFVKPASYPYTDDAVTAIQDHDGPTFVYVGKRASHNALMKAAQRFLLNVSDLLNIRDGEACHE